MAHEITIRANDFAEMAYANDERAWHGLGQSFDPETASIEDVQRAAGMDWKILRSKVRYFADADGTKQLEIPDQHVLMRSDTKAALGIVSDKYKVVQPRHVLEFFRDLTEGAGFKMSTAGTLFGGKKFWALASIGENAQILDRDMIKAYLLLVTSCDGSSSTIAKFVAERTVCNNTLTVGLAEGGKSVKASHRSTFNPSAVKDQLGIARDGFGRMVDDMQTLAKVRMADREAADFVRNLLRPEEAAAKAAAEAAAVKAAGALNFAELMSRAARIADVEPADVKRAPRGEADILRLFRGDAKGSSIPGVQGTAYAMLNAITEYVDHHASAKTDSHRMASAWLNGGDDLKTTAFEQLLTMAR